MSMTTEEVDTQSNGMDYADMCKDKRRDCRSRARGAGKCHWQWAKRDCKKTCKHCTAEPEPEPEPEESDESSAAKTEESSEESSEGKHILTGDDCDHCSTESFN